jgi:hypothetical protein
MIGDYCQLSLHESDAYTLLWGQTQVSEISAMNGTWRWAAKLY